eukprot:jgi/Ulvmu1/5443/UM223_0004.1
MLCAARCSMPRPYVLPSTSASFAAQPAVCRHVEHALPHASLTLRSVEFFLCRTQACWCRVGDVSPPGLPSVALARFLNDCARCMHARKAILTVAAGKDARSGVSVQMDGLMFGHDSAVLCGGVATVCCTTVGYCDVCFVCCAVTILDDVHAWC